MSKNLFKQFSIIFIMDYLKRGVKSKSGQGLSINAIILILLGVVVLILLIVGFTTGGKDFFNLFGKQNNVDDVTRDCISTCLSQGKYDYCTFKRTLIVEKKEVAKTSCYNLSTQESLKIYGVQGCPSITCDSSAVN